MLMNRLSSLLAVLVLLAPPAAADVLQKSRIPAGARWIAHLDVQAMRSSKLYALVREESGKDGADEVADGLAEFRMFAGLDPTQDFESVTLYSVSFSEKGCVALLAGGAKIDGALEKMKTLENYRTTPVQGHVLHTWGDLGDTWYASVHRVSGSEERVVVASQDPAQVVRGLSVLAHESESLAEAAQPAIRATPAAGSILFAAAGESLDELGRIEPVSAVAKLTKAVVLDVGEDRGALSARVCLDTRTPEDAQRIHQVLQGAVALVGLAGGDGHDETHAKLQSLVEGLRISVSDTRVDAVFRYDVRTLVEDLKSLDENDHDAAESREGSRKEHRARKHRDEDKEDGE
jgi:hypothetical protein